MAKKIKKKGKKEKAQKVIKEKNLKVVKAKQQRLVTKKNIDKYLNQGWTISDQKVDDRGQVGTRRPKVDDVVLMEK